MIIKYKNIHIKNPNQLPKYPSKKKSGGTQELPKSITSINRT